MSPPIQIRQWSPLLDYPNFTLKRHREEKPTWQRTAPHARWKRTECAELEPPIASPSGYLYCQELPGLKSQESVCVSPDFCVLVLVRLAVRQLCCCCCCCCPHFARQKSPLCWSIFGLDRSAIIFFSLSYYIFFYYNQDAFAEWKKNRYNKKYV